MCADLILFLCMQGPDIAQGCPQSQAQPGESRWRTTRQKSLQTMESLGNLESPGTLAKALAWSAGCSR